MTDQDPGVRWLQLVGGTLPTMLNRDAIVLSQMASEEAVVRIARSVDGKDWLSDSAVRRIAIYIELTLDGRRLSGGDHYPEVLPDRHLASQRITRDGTVNVWTTVGAEQLLAFTDTTTAERFWSDWFYQTLRELGKRRGLRPLDEFWAPSSDRG